MKFKAYITERKSKAKAKRDPGKVRKCDECGKAKKDVERTYDPYRLDVWDEKVKRNLCHDCYVKIGDEI